MMQISDREGILVKKFPYLKVHYHVHKDRPMNPILSQKNPANISHTISRRFDLILSSRPRLHFSNGLLPSDFLPNILYAHLNLPMRTKS
jgi:hypothetical protein